jgi:RNA polymerase sigma-70 factor (ECF subfamily)
MTIIDADFENLVTTHVDRIHRIAFRVTRSESAAQEITQDVLLRAWMHDDFDATRGNDAGWLGMLTRSASVDWIRHEASHDRRLRAHGPLYSTTAPDTEEMVNATVDAGEVRAAVAVLSAAEREIVQLAFFDGLTYRQVADRLGIPQATLKSRMRAALGHLALTMHAPARPKRPSRARVTTTWTDSEVEPVCGGTSLRVSYREAPAQPAVGRF